MGLSLPLSRNSKRAALLLLVSAFVCFLFVQNNSQLEKQIALGNSFFKQLRELKSQNTSAVNIESEKTSNSDDAITDKEKVPEILHHNKEEEDLNEEIRLFTGDQEFQVTIWIDLPNAFPWRYCVQEYNNLFAILNCDKNVAEQVFTLVPVPNSDQSKAFRWKSRQGQCVVPGQVTHDGELQDSIKPVNCDSEEAIRGHWLWTEAGQVIWSEGCQKCVQSHKFNTPVHMHFCQNNTEDQNMEFGVWKNQSDGSEAKLTPLDIKSWEKRQKDLRLNFMESELVGVRKAVEEVDIDDLLHEFDTKDPEKRRRAAVFYVDQGDKGLDMVRWWIYTWRFIGLDSVNQGFDLVMMTHPAAVSKLPKDCVPVSENYRVNVSLPGQCLYKPYLGVAYRDKTYDPYMNSQECLYGPGSEFLSQYSLLLRADLDTFPTPKFLDWWPDSIIVDKNYHTNFNLDSIKNAIKALACSAGIDHKEWYNPGSTWYGDARRVRNMAKVTVALNKFGRAQMFGPGTECRCATCNKMPDKCQWGGGPYAGTLLLYLQEIAVNKIMTQKEWDTLPSGLLDQGVGENVMGHSVCGPALLHCMHNADRFSKLAFGMGKYKAENMTGYDITKVTDYASFMAISANDQGSGGEEALRRFNNTVIKGRGELANDKLWSEFCSSVKL